MFYGSHIKKNTLISSTDIVHFRDTWFYILVYQSSGLPLRKALEMEMRCLR